MRCFGGFRSSRRYRVDQELEIYNFRVVPDLQISKSVDFLMIHMYLFTFFILILLFFCAFVVEFESLGVKWVGSGPGRLRPVQNDRTGCRNILGWLLAKQSWKKNHEKSRFSEFYPPGLCHFPENSHTNGWSPIRVNRANRHFPFGSRPS